MAIALNRAWWVLITANLCAAAVFLSGATSLRCAPITLVVPGGPPGGSGAPVPASLQLDLPPDLATAARSNQLQLTAGGGSPTAPGIPVQFEPEAPGLSRGTLRWLMPPVAAGPQKWLLEARAVPFETTVAVGKDSGTGQWIAQEGGRPVLQYNYQTNDPGGILEQVAAGNRKYARPRSDYIHPLYGPEGEVLTKDWSVDHPHHRGIYWAWPEVDYRGERGDLHALQRVFARPTGRCIGKGGPAYGRIEAENLWRWEDGEPIVREIAVIRIWRGGPSGRCIDLEFRFTALREDVALARRDTRHYGGLNVRLAAVKEQQIVLHTDAADVPLRGAWGELSGYFSGAPSVAGLAIFQKPSNPDYPGDWIQYPDLNWFQPTFPAAGSRFVLKKDQPLVLEYRLWVHSGKAAEAELGERWAAWANPPRITAQP